MLEFVQFRSHRQAVQRIDRISVMVHGLERRFEHRNRAAIGSQAHRRVRKRLRRGRVLTYLRCKRSVGGIDVDPGSR